jgi:polyisoprenoid-binding protein YceI
MPSGLREQILIRFTMPNLSVLKPATLCLLYASMAWIQPAQSMPTPSPTAIKATAPDYEVKIDTDTSIALFAVRLIWWQTIRGRFSKVQGSVQAVPDTGMVRIRARIPVASVRVHPAHYRQRMLGPNFFDAQTYRWIRFVSQPVPRDDLHMDGHLHGELTLHGVTRPLSLHIKNAHCPGTGLTSCRFHLQGWVDRTRYNMSAHRTLVSTRVELDLVIQLDSWPNRAPRSESPAPAESSPGTR